MRKIVGYIVGGVVSPFFSGHKDRWRSRRLLISNSFKVFFDLSCW